MVTSDISDQGNPGGSGVKNGALAPRSLRAFSVAEFCRRYGIGRTKAYAEIAAGRLGAVKVGQRTLITDDAAEAWLASLPAALSVTRSTRVVG
jgi:excisionase family DNA binding protein